MQAIAIDKTIKTAMESIVSYDFVLPAIQRKFVWSPEQIEMLFDSIMRDYPINGFMLWRVEDAAIRKTQQFYGFLKDYCEHFHETNPDFASGAKPDFFAVIDGQQRLTSLYIGLFGTYRYKKPGKWYKETEDAFPTRRLYLNLYRRLPSQIDNQKEYEFKFLTDDEVRSYNGNEGYFWFKVGEIVGFDDGKLVSFLFENKLHDNEFARATLMKLFRKYHTEEVMNYTTIVSQDQDKVLDIFLRTNSGGTPLSFSDLLMSISSANWKRHDARKEIANVRKLIFGFGNPNFNVSQDFILKAMLVCEDAIRNYSFEDDFLEGLLSSQYQSPACTLVLQLLYPDKVIQFGKAVAQDHMHPKTTFEDKAKLAQLELSDEVRKFFLENYNTVLNLQLLGSQENGAGEKGDTPLQTWANQSHVTNSALFVDEDTSLAIKDFQAFIEARKLHLKASLRQIAAADTGFSPTNTGDNTMANKTKQTTDTGDNNMTRIRPGFEWIAQALELLESNHQVILTGAPGTGKTYTAKQVANAFVDENKSFKRFTTLIPDFDEADVDKKAALKKFFQARLDLDFVEKLPDYDPDKWQEKLFTARVQFHPGYDYSDFVIGMKPEIVDGKDGAKNVFFRWKDGIFKAFADRARTVYDEWCNQERNDPKEAPRFVFIFDEINRADLSRVFGELFSLLEESYRYSRKKDGDGGDEKSDENCITLPNGDEFVIPENLYIIGTMNDIDKSVESMDFALRRRFAWLEVSAEQSECILDACILIS